jgi:glycosyltransferase involved in cell wall biosynthesis
MDMTPLVRDRTGVGTYVFCLLKHLLVEDSGIEYAGLAVTRRPLALDELADAVSVRHVAVPTRAMYWLWNHTGRPAADRLAGGCDVFHGTNFYVPPTRRAKRVVTIHDLSFLTVPQYSSPRIVKPFSRHIRRFVAESDAVMVYSESTRRDLIERLDVDPTQIHVAHMAADERYRPDETGDSRGVVRKHYGLEGPYILFVGAVEPRKNIESLLESFAAVSADVPHTLVIAGPKAWGYDSVRATHARLALGDRVRFLEYVRPDEHLPALYQSADLLALVSHYEGFGLPPLEAMQSGCPVIVADNSSMPEVVGEAGIIVPATDTGAIAEAIGRVLTDTELRDYMSRAGIEQAKRFSWTECARRTAQVYRELAG